MADQKSHKQRNMSGICRKKKGRKEIEKVEMTKMIVINTVGHFRIGFGLFFKASPGGRFSKDPETYRARKAILETMIRLP